MDPQHKAILIFISYLNTFDIGLAQKTRVVGNHIPSGMLDETSEVPLAHTVVRRGVISCLLQEDFS